MNWYLLSANLCVLFDFLAKTRYVHWKYCRNDLAEKVMIYVRLANEKEICTQKLWNWRLNWWNCWGYQVKLVSNLWNCKLSMYNPYKDIRFPIESNSLPKKPVSVSLNNRKGIQRIIHSLSSQDRPQLTSLPRY